MSGRPSRASFSLANAAPPPDPTGAWMTQLRSAFFDAVNEADIKEIADGLVKRAKQGDIAATKLLLTYVCPQPSISIGVRGNQAPPEPETFDSTPSISVPGSAKKIEDMARRARSGVALHHPEDGSKATA